MTDLGLTPKLFRFNFQFLLAKLTIFPNKTAAKWFFCVFLWVL